MDHVRQTPAWGAFALVSYIPDPLGSFLHQLRQALPGGDNPRPHITILPPQPLKLPVEAASKQARKILRQFPAFDIELSRVCYFSGTNFLYLDVSDGNSLLHELHKALNAGDLGYAEEFEFRPHLTLAGPITAGQLDAVQTQAESAWLSVAHSRRFKLHRVAGLWLPPNAPPGEWHRLWSHYLRINCGKAAKLTRAAVTTQRS